MNIHNGQEEEEQIGISEPERFATDLAKVNWCVNEDTSNIYEVVLEVNLVWMVFEAVKFKVTPLTRNLFISSSL